MRESGSSASLCFGPQASGAGGRTDVRRIGELSCKCNKPHTGNYLLTSLLIKQYSRGVGRRDDGCARNEESFR
jgi:hypothetical protein